MTDTNRPLRVFLCHSSADKPVVRELYQKLCVEPWIQPWLDEEELYPGQDWETEIEKAVESSDVVLVCLSNGSINKRGFVQKELRFALDVALEMPEETIFIIPLRLEECTPPRSLRGWQYADYFEGQRERSMSRLLVSLQKRAIALELKFKKQDIVVENISQNIQSEAKTTNLSDVKDEDVLYDLSYTCTLLPHDGNIHITRQLARKLLEELVSICTRQKWRLERINYDKEYIKFSIATPRSESPGLMVRIVRRDTSEMVINNFPSLKNQEPLGDFWAPGYLITGGVDSQPIELVNEYIEKFGKQKQKPSR